MDKELKEIMEIIYEKSETTTEKGFVKKLKEILELKSIMTEINY